VDGNREQERADDYQAGSQKGICSPKVAIVWWIWCIRTRPGNRAEQPKGKEWTERERGREGRVNGEGK
jgi:hypothetical protein